MQYCILYNGASLHLGSWLYFSSIHLLPSPLIQAIVQLVTVLREATVKKSHMIKIGGEMLRINKHDTSFTLASISTAISTPLSPSLYSVFKSYNMACAPHYSSVFYEAMLLSKGFVSANTLSLFLTHYMEKCPPISKTQIKSTIELSSQHIITYYNGSIPTDKTLGVVHSSVVQNVLLSQLHGATSNGSSHVSSRQGGGQEKLSVLQEEEEEEEKEEKQSNTNPLHQKLESLSFIISLWELQLPLPLEVFEKSFPHIKVSAVLEELVKGQSHVANDYPWSREAVESLQESRATSVMMSEKDKDTGNVYILIMLGHILQTLF